MEQSQFYESRNEQVSSLLLPEEKRWYVELIRRNFLKEDADAIVELHVPQRTQTDKMVWTNASDGDYTTKGAYHYWYNNRYGTNTIPHCTGWKIIWHLIYLIKLEYLFRDFAEIQSQYVKDYLKRNYDSYHMTYVYKWI